MKSLIAPRHGSAVLLLVLSVCCVAPCLAEQPPADPLQPFAALAGGTWLGEGTWPDGSPLKVEIRYFWGPTKRLLHFETYDLTSADKAILYEGFLLFDEKRGKVVQYNVKPTGEVSEQVVESADSKGFAINGPQTRSIVRYEEPDVFVWELRVPEGSEWKLIMKAVHRRRP